MLWTTMVGEVGMGPLKERVYYPHPTDQEADSQRQSDLQKTHGRARINILVQKHQNP